MPVATYHCPNHGMLEPPQWMIDKYHYLLCCLECGSPLIRVTEPDEWEAELLDHPVAPDAVVEPKEPRRWPMDLSKLTPAPWQVSPYSGKSFVDDRAGSPLADCSCGSDGEDEANAEFIALARNAFDVMMRREWWAIPGWKEKAGEGCWFVCCHDEENRIVEVHRHEAPWPRDPFTALVEADRWYKENVERVGESGQ